MSKVTKEAIMEAAKGLTEEQQEVILYLAEIFEGDEDTINEYVKNELNK